MIIVGRLGGQVGRQVGRMYLPRSTLSGNRCQEVCAVGGDFQIRTWSY